MRLLPEVNEHRLCAACGHTWWAIRRVRPAARPGPLLFDAGQNIALQDLWRRYEEWARCPSCGSERVGYADSTYAKLHEYNCTKPRRRLFESKRKYQRRVEVWSNGPGGPKYARREAQERLAAAHEGTQEALARVAEARARAAAAQTEVEASYQRASPDTRAKIDEIRRRHGLPPHKDAT